MVSKRNESGFSMTRVKGRANKTFEIAALYCPKKEDKFHFFFYCSRLRLMLSGVLLIKYSSDSQTVNVLLRLLPKLKSGLGALCLS